MTQNNIFPRNVFSPLIWTTRRSSTNFRIPPYLQNFYLLSIWRVKFPETSDGNIQAKIKRIFPPTHFWPTSDPSRYYKYVRIVDQKLTPPASLAEDLREKEEKKRKIPHSSQIPNPIALSRPPSFDNPEANKIFHDRKEKRKWIGADPINVPLKDETGSAARRYTWNTIFIVVSSWNLFDCTGSRVSRVSVGARFRVTARKYNTFIVGDAVMLAP